MSDNTNTYSAGISVKKISLFNHISGKTQNTSEYQRNYNSDRNKEREFQKAEPVAVSKPVIRDDTAFSVQKETDVSDICDTPVQNNVSNSKNDLEMQIILKKVLEVSTNMMCVVKNDIIFMINKSGAELLGNENVNNFCGRNFSEMITEKDRYIFKNIDRVIDGRVPVLTRIIRENGTETECFVKAGYIKRDDTSLYMIEVRSSEVRDAVGENNAVDRAVLYDTLTETCNRLLFNDRLRYFIDRDISHEVFHPVYPVKLSVVAVDISDLNTVCQVYGATTADFVLKTLTDRIKSCKRVSSIYRKNYDTIFLLFDDIENAALAVPVAEMLINLLNDPVIYEYNRLSVECRIGVAIYPLHFLSADDLIKNAEECAHIARAKNNNYKIYGL